MQHFTLPTTSNPTVTLEIGGDLRLSGSEVDEVSAKGDANVQVITNDQGDIEVSASARGVVSVPRHAHIIVLRAGGDARIDGIRADMEIEHVGGDLRLNETVAVTIQHVGGDLKAREIGGALKAEHVGGDVLAKNVGGPCEFPQVGGDVILRDFNGSVTAKAHSDIILKNAAFHPGQNYEFETGADFICRLAEGNSVKFEAATGADLVVRVPEALVDEEHGVVQIGSGAASVKATAGGDVVISLYEADEDGIDGLGDSLSSTINSAVSGAISGALSGLSRNTGRIDPEEIASKARRAAERAQQAADAAQRKAEDYRRKAEKIAEKAESRAGRRRTWGFTINVPTPPRPPAPPRPPMPTRPIVVPTTPRVVNDPVSDEERLSILRMLEQGKISAAEAEKLLAALEGK